jgi:ABC-type multidrug transport system fused ATPase/permease subunit
MTQKANLSDLKKALFILSDEKSKLFLFAFLFLVTATLEMLSLASIGVIISKLVSFTSESAPTMVISDINLGIMVASIFALRGMMIVFLSYKLWHYTVTYGAKLRTRLMSNYQNMSYERFTEIDPGQYSQRILEVCAQFAHTFLWSLLRLVADFIILIAISAYLIYLNSTLFFLAFGTASIIFLISEYFVKPKIKKYGEISNTHSAKMISTVHNGINGLREIKLLNVETYFTNLVRKYALTYAMANVKTNTVQVGIKTLLETVIIIVSILYVIQFTGQSSSSSNILLDLGVFVFGASRAIPAINQLVLGLNKIRYCSNSIHLLYEEFKYEGADDHKFNDIKLHKDYEKDIGQSDSISLHKVSASYGENGETIIKDINFNMKIGSCIGIYGESGSGKSTLINLLSGLIYPATGEVFLSNSTSGMRHKYSYDRVYICPQEPFMIDDTLIKNITLNDIPDEVKAEEALKLAGFEFNKKLKKGMQTRVGVGGKKLSGGQRQRVCVARAIYHDKDFLLLDEPTSSLDQETANIMLSNIKDLSHNKAVLIVSHDLKLLENYCDEIYELNNKKLKKII